MPYGNIMWLSKSFAKTYFILVVLILSSCNTKEKENLVLDQLGLHKHSVDFLKKNIVLPDEFERVNLRELGEMLRQNPDLNAIDKMNYELATRYQEEGISPILFSDNMESPTSIWLIPAPYMKMGKDLVPIFTDMLTSRYIIPLKSEGIDVEILKSSFVRLSGTEAIKVSCKIETFEKSAFYTQYIATRNLDTFSVIVISEFDTATNFIIKSIQF